MKKMSLCLLLAVLVVAHGCKKEFAVGIGGNNPIAITPPSGINVATTFTKFGVTNSTCSANSYYSTFSKPFDPTTNISSLNLFESGWLASVKCPPPPPPPQQFPFNCKDYKHPIPNPYIVVDPKEGVTPKPPCVPIEDISKRIGYFFETTSTTEIVFNIMVLSTKQTIYQAKLTYNTNSKTFKRSGNSAVAVTNSEMVAYHNTSSINSMATIVEKLFNFYTLELK
jgi:hypothetical protein